MSACQLSPTDKKQYGKDVGKILLKQHGAKKYYSVEQVMKASRESLHNVDWHCWAMCLFTSEGEFNAFHKAIGESCDYGMMRGQMTSALTDGASNSWFDIGFSWLDWPDFDLSSVFDLSGISFDIDVT